MKPKNDTLATVTRALRILSFLAERSSGAGVRDIAAAFGLNVSTTYHVLNTLECEGFVVREPASKRYALGHAVSRLHGAFVERLDVAPQLREVVRELAARSAETAYLAVCRGADVVIADIVESSQHVRAAGLYPGYCDHLHARALGRAVLAHWDQAAVERHFEQFPPQRLRPKTPVAIPGILKELERTRVRGYSEDNEEFTAGVCCLGAPYFALDGRVAGAVSVSVPSFRADARRAVTIAAVQAAAEAATRALGGREEQRLG